MNELYLERAMLVTGGFEGSDPWANITGNFDGEGLTCGQLGKTIASKGQQRVVRSYLNAHGEAELLQLMPSKGPEYLRAIRASSVQAAMAIVVPWSRRGQVIEPVRSELAAFWKSAKMVVKQREDARELEGKLADAWVADWRGDGSFREFALFFDIAAQNGSLRGVGRVSVDQAVGADPEAAVATALTWVGSAPAGTSGAADARKNAALWRTLLTGAPLPGVRLFLLAYLRARKAKPEWQWDVINRKGALALAEGWVHGRKWNFVDEFQLASPAEVPVIEELPAKKPVAPPTTAVATSGALFRVAAHSGLRLRSTPASSSSNNILASYPQGTLVRFLRNADAPNWWEVSVDEAGTSRTGFMAAGLLSAVPPPEPAATAPARSGTVVAPASASGVVEVHYPNPAQRPVRRDKADGRIWQLNEASPPLRSGLTPAQRATSLGKIVAWLNAEGSARYLPSAGNTFCNIYIYDYVCLAQCYLPRVWWTQKAIQALSLGHTVAIKYEDTVDEWTANLLYQWFRDWGTSFGWSAAGDLTDLQDHANAGGVSIIVAKNSKGHGHITAVVPETPVHQAHRSATGVLVMPLESQAGSTNYNYVARSKPWWSAANYTVGFWKHA